MNATVIVTHGLPSSDVANSFPVPIEEMADFLQLKGKAYEAFVEIQKQRRAQYDEEFPAKKAADPKAKYNAHDWKHGTLEFYERTQPAPYDGDDGQSRRCMNRVYVDIDGKCGAINQNDFKELDEMIQQTLHFSLPWAHSLMTASKWSKDGNNKLSYRVTLIKKHGSKVAINKFVMENVYPILKESLADYIPLEMKTPDNKKRLSEDKFEDQYKFLLIDSSVYNSVGRKMRMLGQSKPNETRPNTWGELDAEDADVLNSLITYIPEDSEALEEIAESAVEEPKAKSKKSVVKEEDTDTVSQTSNPTESVDGPKPLLVRVAEALGQHRWENYDDFITSGIICLNEDLGLELWERLAAKGPKNKPGDCAKHWAGFKKGRLTQERWWKWLREDNLATYLELIKERTTFWDLIKNPNHAEMAQFFWNTKPTGYVFNETLKWFQLMPTNAWKQYNQAPSGLMTDVWKTLKDVAKDHEHLINWSGEENDWRRKPFKEFLKNIGNSTCINGVIQFLPNCYNDDDLTEKMDENRDVFAFLDKVYDTKTKELRDIRPTDWVCLNAGYKAPVASDPEVRKQVEAVLFSIWEDQTVVDYVKRTIGTCISGTRRFEEFYIWTGKGGNGKGVLSALVSRAFGRYFHTFSHTLLTKAMDKKDAPNPGLAQAKGKRFSQGTEPESEDKLQEGFVKMLSGNDQVEARVLHGNPVRFIPQCGWWLQCNEIPKFNKMTGGSKRRVKVLRFPFQFVEFPQSDHERQLDSSLKEFINKSDAWRDEFILMMIEAYETIGDSMNTPDYVEEATSSYMNKSNPCNDWLLKHYNRVDVKDKNKALSSTELLEAFKADTSDAMDSIKFNGYMELLGVPMKKIGHKFYCDMIDYEKSYITVKGEPKIVMLKGVERKTGNYWWGLERKVKQQVPTEEEKKALNVLATMMR